MRFGAFYRLGMKAVVVAGSSRISQSGRRILSVKLACQRRDGVMITVSWTGVRRLSASLRVMNVAELSQNGRILKRRRSQPGALTGWRVSVIRACMAA